MAGLGWQELVLILLIVVIIFGAGKLPEIGGAVGRGIREFRTATTTDEISSDADLGGSSTHDPSVKDES